MGYYQIPYQAPMGGLGIVPGVGLGAKVTNMRPRGCSAEEMERYRARIALIRADGGDPEWVENILWCCENNVAVEMTRVPGEMPLYRGIVNTDACQMAARLAHQQTPRVQQPATRRPMVAAHGLGIVPGASTREPWCSASNSFRPMQQMLSNLGFYSGPLNGEVPNEGNATFNALVEFARAYGVDASAGVTTAFCEQLINAHNARGSGPSPTPLPSTSPAAALKSQMVYRYRQEPAAEMREGPGPTNGALAPVGGAAGWWASQSTAVKAGIIVGGFGVLGAGAYMLSR